MPNDRPTRSSLLHDISRQLQLYMPGQNWQDIEIKSIADLKTKYPGLKSLKDARSLETMQSLLDELQRTGVVAIMRWLKPIDEPIKQHRRTNPSPNTSGLQPRKSPDCTSKPVQISIMVEPNQLRFLDELDGGRSMNVRSAIRHYQKLVESDD
jgi:hypothetical protein